METVDPAIDRTIEFAAGVIKAVDAIGQPGLLQRPLRPEVSRLADRLLMDASEP